MNQETSTATCRRWPEPAELRRQCFARESRQRDSKQQRPIHAQHVEKGEKL